MLYLQEYKFITRQTSAQSARVHDNSSSVIVKLHAADKIAQRQEIFAVSGSDQSSEPAAKLWLAKHIGRAWGKRVAACGTCCQATRRICARLQGKRNALNLRTTHVFDLPPPRMTGTFRQSKTEDGTIRKERGCCCCCCCCCCSSVTLRTSRAIRRERSNAIWNADCK